MAHRHTLGFLMIAWMAGTGAVAGELAREGSVDSSVCFGGPMHIIAPAANEHYGSYVVKGGTTAANVVFDSMAAECTGAFETRIGKTQSKGYCVFRDASGDTIHGTDALSPDGYVWSYLGGTGKFQGIVGSGKLEPWGTLAPTQHAMRGCRRFIGTYRIR